MAATRRSASSRARTDKMERWQLLGLAARIVIELLEPIVDHFFGPGRLL
jgi:hypothetical protein